MLAEKAPAENFVLDERVTEPRASDFFSFNSKVETQITSTEIFAEQHKGYSRDRLIHRPVSATFDEGNSPNHFLANDMDVVRLERLDGLCERNNVRLVDSGQLQTWIKQLIDDRDTGNVPATNVGLGLRSWLKGLNGSSDQRPTFVAPFAAVEALLDQADWANQLRDVLGLGHFQPQAGQGVTVVAFRYNMERVRKKHQRAPGFAAAPSVLDDMPTSGGNVCFLPAPVRLSPPEYGSTVDLSGGGNSKSEFVHASIPYEIADIWRIGEVTTGVSDDQISSARSQRISQLSTKLNFFSDLPS